MGSGTVVSSSGWGVCVPLLLFLVPVAVAEACQAARVALEMPFPPVVGRTAVGRGFGIAIVGCSVVVGVSGWDPKSRVGCLYDAGFEADGDCGSVGLWIF